MLRETLQQAKPEIASAVIEGVETQGLGFAPILRHYFEKCSIQHIIDENVPLDPRRKVLTHGQAAVAMITGILFQVMALYRICSMASRTTVLDVIYPGIGAQEYFDDRLGDTLDAIFDYGIGNLELQITSHMIDVFQIRTEACHNDTTSASYYGAAGHNQTDQSIQITFGHSKKHRQDLKQLVWSMSVSSDSAFPLFQQPYSGNAADVSTYVEQWHHLIDLLGRRDFLYVADSKLITKESIAHLCDNEGFFVAPAPMYESYKAVFEQALQAHDREILIPYKDQVNRGFEVPMSITYQDRDYPLRMIILFDHGLGRRKRQGLLNRVEKTRAAFAQLSTRLNSYSLKTLEAIEKESIAILKHYHTQDYFTYQITNTPIVTYKNQRRGRPSKTRAEEKIPVVKDHFNVDLTFHPNALEEAQNQCGYYPLLTNQSAEELSIEQAMLAHKGQYKIEHTHRRAKGSYALEPIYLHFPERIEAFLFLFKIALQLVVLIERTARQNIQQRDRGLDDFMPNRKDVRNPKAEYLLSEFQYVVTGHVPLPDGQTYGFVSQLSHVQKEILSILEVPMDCYSYQYLYDSS